MKGNYLELKLPFLKTIKKERREQFETYFRTAPIWLMEYFTIEVMEAGTIFIREDDPVDMIYLVGSGTIKATDYRIYGISYDFMLFTKVYAYGGMEVLMNLDRYKTTLQTVTKCTMVKIPRAQFQKWMETDIQALRHEAHLMGEYLLEQARGSRAFLFLQGSDRLALLFINRYKLYSKDGVMRIKGDRQELSDSTGLCLKTITRAIKKFKEDGLITKEGSYIIVDKEQYKRMKEIVSEVLADEL